MEHKVVCGVRLDPGLGETVACRGFQAEDFPPKHSLGVELGTGLLWPGSLPATPSYPPPPGGLPGGGDRLSDETHYALNPPD